MTHDVIRALARRWYVLVTGLLLSAGLAWGAYVVTPPTYTAAGLILLLPSKASVGPGGNPFLALSNLDQPAGILVAYFSGATAQADVKAKAPEAQYQVSINSSTRGPIVEVDVTDTTAKGALDTLGYITSQVPVTLSRLQRDVDAPADAVITSMPLTIDRKAKANFSGTTRMVIAAAIVGLLATGGAAFALDGLLMSRRLRRQAQEAAPTKARTAPVRAGSSRRGARSGPNIETGRNDLRRDEATSHSGPLRAGVRRGT